MRQFLSVVVFTLLTVGFFTVFSNFGIPQIEPAPPPKEEKIELGAMTMESFIAIGERIFKGKGTCTLCHNPIGKRAPLLNSVGKVAPKRLADPRYTGGAKDVETYIYESMTKPSAYVVKGFGKKGSGDTVSPMPNVSAGSIGLGEVEIKAVIAYLQSASGTEVTVEIPSGAKPPSEAPKEEGGDGRPLYASAEAAIGELGCGACHKIAGAEGNVGPDLTHIGAKRDKAYLRRAILKPNADIAQGFEPEQMPPDYGEQLYAKELEMIVTYLSELK